MTTGEAMEEIAICTATILNYRRLKSTLELISLRCWPQAILRKQRLRTPLDRTISVRFLGCNVDFLHQLVKRDRMWLDDQLSALMLFRIQRAISVIHIPQANLMPSCLGDMQVKADKKWSLYISLTRAHSFATSTKRWEIAVHQISSQSRGSTLEKAPLLLVPRTIHIISLVVKISITFTKTTEMKWIWTIAIACREII